MIDAIKEWEKINEQQGEYIKVIKGDIESLKESYKISREYNEVADKEIERLNNNWNELEKFICDLEIECIDSSIMWGVAVIIHNKLKELKGSDKSE